MPAALSYPGVYIEEVPSGVRTITGVATSITAFLGRALRGPVNQPVRVQSFAEYERIFGGLWAKSTMGHAVNQFFQHGGRDALIVRLFNGTIASASSTITAEVTGGTDMVLEASSPGEWGRRLRAKVDHAVGDPTPGEPQPAQLFNILIEELDSAGNAIASEMFRNVSPHPDSSRSVVDVLNEQSALVNVKTPGATDKRPKADTFAATNAGGHGNDLTNTQLTGSSANRTGIYALDHADLFNLLCIPPPAPGTDVTANTWKVAAKYCQDRRALLIVDSPDDWTATTGSEISNAASGVNTLRGTVGNNLAINAAAFFPHLRMPDPLNEGRLADFVPCGAVAGIMARTDVTRGVWKAPAGLDASFSGANGFTYTMTDPQNGQLNPLGLNCLRSFPVSGHLVWGTRTLAGADQLASEWKYVPVRRLALYLEESLFRGTQWVVFEPNDQPLWAQIRLSIGSFMQGLFRQGAFQGAAAKDAYFVKCDSETTTQNDINNGIVNILVGFAPLKPAEFVVVKIQQMAGLAEV